MGIIILLIIVVLVFTVAIKLSKIQKADKKEKGYNHMAMYKHMAGLPIAEGVNCVLYIYPDRYEFEKDHIKVELDINKVSDVVIKTEIEIQTAFTSSAGGAVGGALLFGPLGAMIGGRTKKKTSKQVSKFLIFCYDKEGSTEYISFDITNNTLPATNFVNDFKLRPKDIKKVSL